MHNLGTVRKGWKLTMVAIVTTKPGDMRFKSKGPRTNKHDSKRTRFAQNLAVLR